jgi:hypothetical protein
VHLTATAALPSVDWNVDQITATSIKPTFSNF